MHGCGMNTIVPNILVLYKEIVLDILVKVKIEK